ncbi:hypothetical protein PO909_017918 [Leuciscus waleckii]
MNVLTVCWRNLFPASCPTGTRHTRTLEDKDWEPVLADCRRISTAMAHNERVDTARAACRYAITIPGCSEALISARLPARTYGMDGWVVVEPHGGSPNIEVVRTLAIAHRGRVPVRVRNVQPYPVTIHRHQGLAQVTTVGAEQVREGRDIRCTLLSPGVVEVGVLQTGLRVDGRAVDVPEHLCCESLQGEALEVDQKIPTGDAAPVRERYRPVPPTLYQEIRTLLQDFTTHLTHLEEVFRAMEQYGMKLRPEKCQLFRKEVKYLGHCVSCEGVSPRPREGRSCAGVAAANHCPSVGTGRPRGRGSPRIVWSPECTMAFQRLKQELLQAPILAYADFTKPFIVYTDASNCGLGAVLAQHQGGVERVIAYASQILHPAERNDSNYSSFKLELLALKWALMEKFKDYLWGAKVTVVTDNNPLVHLRTAKLGAVEQRWVAQLANFDYDIKYRPGRQHVNADVLSRLPSVGEDSSSITAYTVPEEGGLLVGIVEATGTAEGPVPTIWGWNPGRWQDRQKEDQDLATVCRYLEKRALPAAPERRAQTQMVRKLLGQWTRLSLREGVVCRSVHEHMTNATLSQIVVPQTQVQSLLEAYHSQMGHQGQERTLSLLRRSFYWPQMEASVHQFIQRCARCTLRKTRPNDRAPLVPVVPKAPLHILATDFLTLGRPTDRYQNILVLTDLFTKYAWAITVDQTALTTARALWNNVIQSFGCPEVLHSDQGPNFESAVIRELCQVYGCKKTHTTPYHPQENGGCERFNQTLLSLLGTLKVDQQRAAATRNQYDRTARDAPLLPGERVLVLDNRRQGKGKLSDRWEQTPYVVVSRSRPDLPVYKTSLDERTKAQLPDDGRRGTFTLCGVGAGPVWILFYHLHQGTTTPDQEHSKTLTTSTTEQEPKPTADKETKPITKTVPETIEAIFVLEPKPHRESDQEYEPAPTSVNVTILVEYEGME